MHDKRTWGKFLARAVSNGIRAQRDFLHFRRWREALRNILPETFVVNTTGGPPPLAADADALVYVCECGLELESEALWKRHLANKHGWLAASHLSLCKREQLPSLVHRAPFSC